MSENQRSIIEAAFEERASITPGSVSPELKSTVLAVLGQLDSGALRVAEKQGDDWHVHQWLKKAVLLGFRIRDNEVIDAGYTKFYDKVPLKYGALDPEQIKAGGTRIVPHAIVRQGAYVAPNTVLMPSYINIGAYVDSGSMIDTWVTVGSCAQIGKNVHLSGGVGIGGVLEPLQANPTIIEDGCFIGARSEIVEGVIVEQGAVISMGVFIGQSTKIYDRESGQIHRGRVPAGAVVVPGSLPSKNGQYSLACAVIVKRVDQKTRAKVGVNELLRSIEE